MNARVMILLTLLAAASPSHVTYDRLLRADREPQNWLSYSGNYAGHRYSPLSQINRTNVKSLQLKWSYHPLYAKNRNSQNKMENTPLVVDGIMYTGTALEAVALDAVTGRQVPGSSRARSIRRSTTTRTKSTKAWRLPETRCSGPQSIAICSRSTPRAGA